MSYLRSLARRLASLRHLGDADFSPVFICGIAGSGTTLLTGLLDQRYENAACLQESALRMSRSSPLKLHSVSSYQTLENYRQALALPQSLRVREVRRASLELYRRVARYPKTSSIVLDKAPNAHLVRAAALRSAFPESRFLLLHRDPVSSIEGWRRKWPVLAAASLTEVCDFWEFLHDSFLRDAAAFAEDVAAVSYATLVEDTEATVARLARFCGLSPRGESRQYADLPNTPGKGLRNVKDGRIVIDDDRSERPASFCLSDRECELIAERLGAIQATLCGLDERAIQAGAGATVR